MSQQIEPDCLPDDLQSSTLLNYPSAPPALSGKLGSSPQPPPLFHVSDQLPSSFSKNTLDESVTTSINRDLHKVIDKTKQVLLPRQNQNALKEWDLWGPLLFILSLSVLMSVISFEEQSSLVFTQVFVLLSVGSCVVTLNSKLLGGQISFLQSVCSLGYCIFPLVLAAFVILLIGKNFISLICVIFTVFWAAYAACSFIASSCSPNRKFLTVYPVILFYSVLGWAIFA
ncbi:hypothetical protein BB561_004521 [Smittium simulii]|uniref:Protein YIP n=1 Tax=Smittium simulii TaxID=133385 RepID=A0A2T9YFV6_9FUNG|nr:hypothetical protein BB561_004521 [Smittium simulii]